MSGKTELIKATLISEDIGGGVVTDIHVSAPITGGGAGPVVPIGATQSSAADAGFVPSPGVGNHSKILWDDGWFVPVPPVVGFPITGDGVTLTTDAGDFVIQTGAGVERVRVSGGAGVPTFTLDSTDPFVIQNRGALTSVPSSTALLNIIGTDSSGSFFYGAFGTLDSTDKVVGFAPYGNLANGLLYMAQSVGGATPGRILIDNNGYGAGPLATLDVAAQWVDTALFAHSASGISGLFQTSATDGSNASPTLVVRANTNQASPLLQLEGVSAKVFGITSDLTRMFMTASLDIHPGETFDGTLLSGNFGVAVNDGAAVTATHTMFGSNGLHDWTSGAFEMTFDNTGKLTVPGVVDAAGYSSAGGAAVILPAANAAGVLTNDGAGNLSWV